MNAMNDDAMNVERSIARRRAQIEELIADLFHKIQRTGSARSSRRALGLLSARGAFAMMRAAPSIRLKYAVPLILFWALTDSPASAQTPEQAQDLESALIPGMTAWITDSSGREEKTRIVGVSGDIVTTAIGEEMRRLRTADVRRVRVRKSDRLINGAVIGAGAGIASGLLLCNLTEPWENCRDDAGPMFRIGAIGAGVGIAVDALIRGRKTIYAAPIVARHGGGLRIALEF
jgi:hypothetical protein